MKKKSRFVFFLKALNQMSFLNSYNMNGNIPALLVGQVESGWIEIEILRVK